MQLRMCTSISYSKEIRTPSKKARGLAQRREELESKGHLLEQYFGRSTNFQIDFISDKRGRGGPPARQSFLIKFEQAGSQEHEGKKMLVGLVPLIDLQQIHAALGAQFFDRNIRAALSETNAPNRKLKEAFDQIVLKEREAPSVFAFRHNGVTLAAERVEPREGGLLVHVPRLLNGAQTVSTLSRFLEQHAGNPTLQRNQDRLTATKVLAKVVVDDPVSAFVTQVTISNNQQNPVHPWALRAMDQIQVDFADKFRDELQIYYSRQEGSFENLSDDQLEELGVARGKDIRIRPLAQTFLAVQGEVVKMRQLPEVFESQKRYEETFRSSFLNGDAQLIVLAYKVGQMLNRATFKLEEALPVKLEGAPTMAKNLTWCLLIQALLNDRNIHNYREEFGVRLAKEPAYGDLLKKLTAQKVAPLVKELCSLPTNQPKIEQAKFDFLRTKEAFKRAMNSAQDRFGWSKRGFASIGH